MKKVFLILGEIACVLLLVGFIAFVSGEDKISTVPFKAVASPVTSACDLKGLEKRDKLEIKRRLSLDVEACKRFIYYSSDSVMDVRELLVVFCDSKENASSVKETISKYVSQRAGLFEGYAPKESELLASHLLTEKKGYVLFYVGEDKEKVLSAFSSSI